MYSVHRNTCSNAAAPTAPQHLTQSKTSYYASASCDLHVEDSLSSSVSSLSSSGKAVAQHYTQRYFPSHDVDPVLLTQWTFSKGGRAVYVLRFH